MPSYKFHYFNLRARGELARWIFHFAGQEFEDDRVEFPQWPALKSKTPYGQLPYLEVDGNTLAQSTTIARYLARQFGLTGANEWEAAQADEIVDYVKDAATGYGAWVSAFMSKNQELANGLKEEYTTKGVFPFLDTLERKLSAINGGNGFFVGSKPTWADFAVALFLEDIQNLSANILDKYPTLKAFTDRVRNLNGIKEWLNKRPVTPI